MPKRIYKLNDFSGGINNLQDAADIKDNEVQDAKNVMFNVYGGIQPPYIMTDSSNNKISAYNNDEITTIQPGYGLGFFETDHQRDSTTVSFTGTNDDSGGSEDGFFVYQEDGSGRSVSAVNNRLKLLSGGVVQDLGSSFSIGDLITITGNTSTTSRSFSDGMLRGSSNGVYRIVDSANSGKELILDRGLIVRLDSTTAKHFNLTLVGFSPGDNVILLADPAAHNIDVFSTSANSYTHNVITLRSTATDIPSKVKYYKSEESIRCCDTADKNSSKIQWYGWIQRKHFQDSTSTLDESNSYMNYFAKDNDLAIPTSLTLASTSATTGAISTYPTAGTGFVVAIATETDEDGLIESGVYELASTFIYDDNQESLPFPYTNTHTVSEENEFRALSLNIGATSPYDPRISGGRIYIRKQGDDSEYIMLLDIHLTKGARTKLSDEYTPWDDAGSSNYNCPTTAASANFRVRELGFITYEVINGYSSSVFSNALGDSGEHWKDSVVSNNRVFVCNVTMKDENTGSEKLRSTLRSYPDRIMYSMPHRFDTFPSGNSIETSKGDADVYVAIEAYADRLLAYKRNSLDIINISGDDVNWFLEESRQYQGVSHPEAVKKTQYGIVWANEQGLYLYDGSSIINLKKDKIRDSLWSIFISSTTGIIYDQQESMIFVVQSLDNKGDAYMCDLKKGNFTYIEDFVLESNDGLTNSVDTHDNNTLIAHDSGSSIDIYKLYRVVVSTQDNIEFQTKDIDFGDPSQVKKVYSVVITYKSSGALTNKFTLVESDGTSHALSGTIATSASNWSVVKLTPSSPVVCNKISVKLDTASDARGVYINDIGIEYRTIYRKGV